MATGAKQGIVTPTGDRTDALSYGQQALWFLHRLQPASTAYNFVFAARVIGSTSDELLRASVQGLARRHAMLRTTYTSQRGTPVQNVPAPYDVAVESISCPKSTPIRQRLADEAYRPFDLERGPVFRAAIITTTELEQFLLLSAHHIAVDFESIGLLLEDLREFYRAYRSGKEPPLGPLPVEYSDYVRWQAELIGGAEGVRLWEYWRKQLAPPLPVVHLPVDHQRSPVQTFHGSTVTFETGSDLAGRLALIARDSEATLSSVILAAFQMVLHEWTGQDDLPVGCVTPGRSREFARVVGYFVNPVVVRTCVKPRESFRTLVKRVQATVDAAWAHQHFPFSLLVERLQPSRAGGVSPLFQVLFAMYDLDEGSPLPLLVGAEGVRVDLGDLQLESVAIDHRGAMLDLSLIAARTGGNVTIHLQFNADLFDRKTINALADRFQRLLGRVSDDGSRTARESAARLAPVAGPALELGEVRADAAPSMAFSLFFFASDEAGAGTEKYRLLLEAARFADAHGFSAVWTPERHFHPFGGIYPNPAVTGAAVAAITTRLQIRAGSVVLPLHHPIRVAEEWSVVDNISGGRVAVSFASGWHANDFVIAPANYAHRREIMAREIETVRRLWRGEAVTYIGGDGRPVGITVWPRPVQPELPIWITAFGSPETFRLAGQLGAGLLTHLLGQSITDLAAKIAIYRNARREQGFDPAGGEVAVMLHTFVGDDLEVVRQTVRPPFLEYLRTSIDLAKVGEQAGLPAGGEHYEKATVDAFLEATFNRYFETNTLFGTPETCSTLVRALRAVGVTEVACLVDFGIDTDGVLAGLDRLERLRVACSSAPPSSPMPPDPADAHRAVQGVRDRVQMRRQSMEHYPRGSRGPESRDPHLPKDDRA
jgi:natural product biosynthesis luciferase-like monooxygenase protein